MTPLLALTLLARSLSLSSEAAPVQTEVTSAGPGLGVIARTSTVHAVREDLVVGVLPLHVGWDIGAAPPGATPTRFGAALGSVRYGDWLEVRALEATAVESETLGSKSTYVHPLGLTLTRGTALVPGLASLSGRLDLTLSLWQTTRDRGVQKPPPMLACGSGSLAQASLELTLERVLSLAVIAGLNDDPAHLGDGRDCLGGGDVWRSSRWVGARAELAVAHAWSLLLEAGGVAEQLHTVVDAPHEHPNGEHEHEHVVLRGAEGLEAGASLRAGF